MATAPKTIITAAPTSATMRPRRLTVENDQMLRFDSPCSRVVSPVVLFRSMRHRACDKFWFKSMLAINAPKSYGVKADYLELRLKILGFSRLDGDADRIRTGHIVVMFIQRVFRFCLECFRLFFDVSLF